MPTICMFRGIKVYINWREHQPPHFHATYGGKEVIVSIDDLEPLEGSLPNKQLKMLLGWAAFHQEESLKQKSRGYPKSKRYGKQTIPRVVSKIEYLHNA